MNFEEVLKHRQNYSIHTGSKDELYDAIINESYDYDYALLLLSTISKNKGELLKAKYVDMIIQITSPFAWTSINFLLVHFTKEPPSKILTGIFKGKVCEKGNKIPPQDGTWYIFEKKTEDFNNLIDNINSFLKDRRINRSDLNIINYSDFDIDNINPFYYTEQAIKIRKELQESDYKYLKDIADIISVPTDKEIEGKFIDSTHFEYPLTYEELPTAKLKRAIRLKKGDIICLLVGEQTKFYLYNNDYENLYIKAGNYCIIRVKDKIINNYLINYLNDEKARMYFTSAKNGIFIQALTLKDLGELKVIIPTEEMIKIADETAKLTLNLKTLSPDEINELIRKSHNIEYKNESQRMINQDFLNAISKLKNKAIRKLINDDLNEVEICFENKAYKSAIILCGSILEAVLLDWLSEFENADNILNVAKKSDGKDLELSKIIEKLEKLVRPYWYEATKAQEIRETRNMVHPKVCIRHNIKVNLEECKKIIDDLNDIIESKECRN